MSATTPAIQVVEHTMDQLESILDRAKSLGLPEEEVEILRQVVQSNAFLLDLIRQKNVSMERLQKIVFGAKTETRANVTGRGGKAPSDGAKRKKKRKGHGRRPASAYTGGERKSIPHESLAPGDPCPGGCGGRVYRKEPRRIVRIRGGAPFVATVFEQECLRCGTCLEVYPAKLPPEVGTGAKYDETVASMAALLRYGNGMPMTRIEGLQTVLGMPFPASTQWELMASAATKIAPAHEELIRQAAQGTVLYNDDTPMKILDYMIAERKRKERGAPPPDRTGVFTSGIVAELSEGRRIVLYFTGRRHAGENLAEVLGKRASGLDPPLQMCDGLDRNLPPGLETILGNCLMHGRRGFVDVVSAFPEEVEHVIDELALVYRNDARAKAEGLTAEERLRLHRDESGPVMKRLKAWMDERIEKKKVEPNSGLGQAIEYCRKRWDELTLFLREPGAPLDNGVTERMLKRAILHRKNSLFYKTQNGAAVGDLFMSLIATAKLAKADPFDYLNELQRHARDVAEDPAAWMPWNYRQTLGTSPGPA
jgi:hypothetical protein